MQWACIGTLLKITNQGLRLLSNFLFITGVLYEHRLQSLYGGAPRSLCSLLIGKRWLLSA